MIKDNHSCSLQQIANRKTYVVSYLFLWINATIDLNMQNGIIFVAQLDFRAKLNPLLNNARKIVFLYGNNPVTLKKMPHRRETVDICIYM